LKESGTEVIDLPDEDLETWKNLPEIKAMPDAWVNNMVETTNLSEQKLREILQQLNELLPEYSERYPQEW
jgi:hypothetical protein